MDNSDKIYDAYDTIYAAISQCLRNKEGTVYPYEGVFWYSAPDALIALLEIKFIALKGRKFSDNVIAEIMDWIFETVKKSKRVEFDFSVNCTDGVKIHLMWRLL